MLFVLFLLSTLPCSAQTLDIAQPVDAWTAFVGGPGPVKIELDKSNPWVAVNIDADGDKDDHPILARSWDTPQDWSKFSRMKIRMQVSGAPELSTKHCAFVFYDEQARLGDGPDAPMAQQVIVHSAIPLGQWMEFDDWLSGIKHGAIRRFEIYMYEWLNTEYAPWRPHSYRWDFARLELQAVGADELVFDGEMQPRQAMQADTSQLGLSLHTEDGSSLGFDKSGRINRVAINHQVVSENSPSLSGLLVRDVKAGGPPVAVDGEISETSEVLLQVADLSDMGLRVQANYRVEGSAIDISGTVSDLTGEERAVTVYFALPLSGEDWRWWDSISKSRTDADETQELAVLERDAAWGLHGMHSKYPMGAISLPDRVGITLALRMDEPVAHRIAWHPELGIFYVAFDFALIQDTSVKGHNLAQAPFHFIIDSHDPAWGMRSAWQKYYARYPELFTRYKVNEGTWWCWGGAMYNEKALESGAGISWGPYKLQEAIWDSQHNQTSLNYIDSEHYEQAMGDWETTPTWQASWDRLNKLANGDPAELAIAAEFYHARIGGGHLLMEGMDYWKKQGKTVADYLQLITRGAVNSVAYDANGKPQAAVEKQPWLGDHHFGLFCTNNLDPDIPEGKGRFNFDVAITTSLEAWESQGARIDGMALDIFGVPGANYRREHFKYVDTPLTFSPDNFKPVQVTVHGSIEWLRELAQRMHSTDRVIMVNSGSLGFLSFAGPSLDIFGSETPTFADPDFVRAIAHHKTMTALTYGPRPKWETASQLLHAVYPGQGTDLEDMAQYITLLRELSAAGWEPVTGVRSSVGSVRLERFGAGIEIEVHEIFRIVAFNPTDEKITCDFTLDEEIKALGNWQVLECLPVKNGVENKVLAIIDSDLSVELDAKQTRVFEFHLGQ